MPPGEPSDPYRVWVSEIMLQQIRVETAERYFDPFVDRWPTVEDLAAAPLEEVLRAWAGLGRYARAHNLHACARVLVERHGGRFPEDEADLAAMPGIGPYTAAAIAAIAFGRKATPVDGNVERVIARLFAVEEPVPAARRRVRELAAALTPVERPGDYVQAVMDLGATVCLPRRPRCDRCPWCEFCRARVRGIAERLPVKPPRPPRPRKFGVAFWAERPDGAVLLRRRPPKGPLGGMMELPSTEWRARAWSRRTALPQAPFAARWRALPGRVRHPLSHCELEFAIFAAGVAADAAAQDGVWIPRDDLAGEALPALTRKIVRHAMERGAKGPRSRPRGRTPPKRTVRS